MPRTKKNVLSFTKLAKKKKPTYKRAKAKKGVEPVEEFMRKRNKEIMGM